jgi:HD-GYP domain-containing protein (c-di-GMP phosphodiesterase class II)
VDKEINRINLVGFTSVGYFKTIVDKRIKRYYKDNKPFSIFILEFNVKDEIYLSQATIFAECIAEIISEKMVEDQDYCTVEKNNKFTIFFSEKNMNLAFIIISKIMHEIYQKIGDYIEIGVGASECPQNGTTYDELIYTANYYVTNTRESSNKSVSSSHFGLSRLSGKSNNDITENKKIKVEIIKYISTLIIDINNYDKYLSKHSALVTLGALVFSKELDLPWLEVERIVVAALLHDIGYIMFPQNIFQKPSRLTPEEWQLVRTHPSVGCDCVLGPLKVFDDYLPIIQNHHEFIDGSGYPFGKKGEQIPIGAQIISIIDSYQAMTSDRVYRKAIEFDEVIDIYIRNAGIKWEKDLITVFTALIADPMLRDKLSGGKNMEFENSSF